MSSLILNAIKSEDLAAINEALSKIDINSTIANGRNMLQLAILSESAKVVEFLLKKGADPNILFTQTSTQNSGNGSGTTYGISTSYSFEYGTNSSQSFSMMAADRGIDTDPSFTAGRTMLECAIILNLPKIVELLIQHGANQNYYPDMSALEDASIRGERSEIINIIIRNGCSPQNIKSAFALAATNNRIDSMEAILQSNFDMNVEYEDDITPLHFAVNKGHIEAVKYLVERGAYLNVAAEGKTTPLGRARQKGFHDIAEFLFNNGAEMIPPELFDDGCPMQAAVLANNFDILKQVCFPEVINKQDYSGATALHRAIHDGKYEMVEFLIKNGADLYIKDKFNATPIERAVIGGNLELAKLVLENNVEINDKRFEIPLLHWAVKFSTFDMTKYLLEQGADITKKFDNYTALELAQDLGREDVAALILKHTPRSFS